MFHYWYLFSCYEIVYRESFVTIMLLRGYYDFIFSRQPVLNVTGLHCGENHILRAHKTSTNTQITAIFLRSIWAGIINVVAIATPSCNK